MSRRRQLSDEDRSLWTSVARSITPLRRPRRGAEPAAKPATELPDTGDAAPAPRVTVRDKSPPPVKSPPLAPFDRRLKQRVARGRDAIDVRIDLHGLTQREAHDALLSFLRHAQADGAKIVLVVTGKGARKDQDAGGGSSERGVLRRQVPMWLALPEFRPFIVGFEEAHVSHGGQGALYVRLRRGR
jgi:DNA-nicking Smr family endonuclease